MLVLDTRKLNEKQKLDILESNYEFRWPSTRYDSTTEDEPKSSKVCKEQV